VYSTSEDIFIYWRCISPAGGVFNAYATAIYILKKVQSPPPLHIFLFWIY